ncbi:MAG: CsgG/HfaB family protein [Endomicrobiia bacterium]
MKKSIFFLLLAFFIGCGPRVAIRHDYDFRQIKRVGVLKFDSSQVGIFSDYDPGSAVADEFVFQLLNRGVTVVERSQLENIIKEQDLGQSGRLDTSTIKKIGKILGVDALIMGTVIKCIPDRKERFYLKDDQGRLREEIFLVNAEVGINARMVDTETGMVIWASSYSYDSFYIDSAIRHTVSALMNTLNHVWPTLKEK